MHMANPPHFPTIPLAEHFGHDINHNTPPCYGDQNRIADRPVPLIPVTMQQMAAHPRGYWPSGDIVRQRFSLIIFFRMPSDNEGYPV